jgi:hypothetical protein
MAEYRYQLSIVGVQKMTPQVIPTINDAGEPVVVEPVREGDCYRFEYNMETRAGHVHPDGSLLHVVQATQDCPHGEISQSGTNWLCKTEFGVGIWATLEQCIARGLLVRVD